MANQRADVRVLEGVKLGRYAGDKLCAGTGGFRSTDAFNNRKSKSAQLGKMTGKESRHTQMAPPLYRLTSGGKLIYIVTSRNCVLCAVPGPNNCKVRGLVSFFQFFFFFLFLVRDHRYIKTASAPTHLYSKSVIDSSTTPVSPRNSP